MRPISTSYSALKSPLNEILGYQGNIGVLRCLAVRPVSMSYSELSERSDITLPGVHKTVKRLVKTGVLAHSGSGKQQLIAMRNEHPLSGIIKELFKEESERFERLIKTIRRQIDELSYEVLSAWIYGSVASDCDQYGDPMQIAILGKVGSIGLAADELRNRLIDHEVELQFDVSIEIKVLTRADLIADKKLILDDIIHLIGIDPIFFAEGRSSGSGNRITHHELDKRSRLAGKAWAVFIGKYPEIISRTVRSLEKRISKTDDGTKKTLDEWKQILETMPAQRLAKLLASDSERATRLRQSNPLWTVLTNEEKEKLEQIQSRSLNNEP